MSGAVLDIFCACGSAGGSVDELRQLGTRRRCKFCHSTIWPPTVRVIASAAAIVHRLPPGPGRRRRVSRKS